MRLKPRGGMFGSYLLTRLIITGLGGVVILIGLFVFLGSNALQKSTEQALTERLLLARQTAANLNFALEQSLLLMEKSFENHPLDFEGDLAYSAKPALCDAYSASPISLSLISLVDHDGVVLFTEPYYLELIGTETVNYVQVQETLQKGSPIISPSAIMNSSGQPTAYLTVPIRTETGDIAAAQATIDLTSSNLADFIQPVKPGERGYTQLVDSRGFVLASTELSFLFTKGDHSDQFTELISRGATTAGTCHGCHQAAKPAGKQREALAFAPLPNVSWGVAIREPEDDVLAPTRWLRLQLALLSLASFLAVAGLALIFARSVVKPLAQLGAAASRIGTGDLAEPVPAVGQGEIAELATSLNTMRGRLLVFREELEQWNRELESRVQHRTRELSALVQASQTLVSTLEPKDLFTTIMHTAVGTFESADGGILFLYDPTQDKLISAASIGYDSDTLSHVKLEVGEAIAGKVFQRREPMRSNNSEVAASALEDASPDNRLYLTQARQNQEIQRYISVPLEADGNVLGSLILVGLRRGLAFSPLDLQLVTAFANLAAALLQKVRLLEEASRAEALRRTDELKTEFLANVSHELQTPLASLRGSLDFILAADTRGLGESQVQLLHNSVRSAERLSRLINDLMDVSRLQAGHMALNQEPLDLRGIIKSLADTFRPLVAKKSQPLELVLPSEPVMVVGDRRRLEQALDNLLSNANRYSPVGSRIIVELHEQDGQAVVSIADTGPGIPPEKQELVFQRFFREEDSRSDVRGGMGLGLTIARGLAELHGGRLWVESRTSGGSTFRLSLPTGKKDEDTDS